MWRPSTTDGDWGSVVLGAAQGAGPSGAGASAAGPGIAVVGASLAGVAAADAIRDAGYTGPLHLIDAAADEPYDRPPLSKQMLAGPAADPAPVPLRPGDHWRRRDITLRLGARVTDLDARSRRLTLAGGERLDCAAVVLAPGSVARPLPFPVRDGAAVHVLRTLADGRRLATLLRTARSLAVIGAGFVGLEVASAARARGIDVTVVDVAVDPLAGAIGAPAAEYLLRLHRAAGTVLRLGTAVRSVGPAGAGVVVTLGSGDEIRADAAVAGVGALPAVDWLATSGLAIGDGVHADARLRCADGIFVAGDAASWPNPVYGTRMRVEHWTTAREQGARAGANAAALLLSGRPGEAFAHVPYVWSDQLGRKAQFVGHLLPGAETVVDRCDDTGLVSHHWLGGRLIAATAIGAPRDVMAARRRIGSEWRDLGPVAADSDTEQILQGAMS